MQCKFGVAMDEVCCLTSHLYLQFNPLKHHPTDPQKIALFPSIVREVNNPRKHPCTTAGTSSPMNHVPQNLQRTHYKYISPYINLHYKIGCC